MPRGRSPVRVRRRARPLGPHRVSAPNATNGRVARAAPEGDHPMLGFIQKLFDQNDREVKRLENEVVQRTNDLEDAMAALPDLAVAFADLRRRHLEDGETLDDLMP